MNIKELIALTKTRTKRIQSILYATILDYMVKEIYVKDDIIVFNQSNINIINKIDKLSNKNTTPSYKQNCNPNSFLTSLPPILPYW